MDNRFSQFLDFNETLICVAGVQRNHWFFYLIFFLVLPLIFFFMYPMTAYGHRGFFLWLSLLFLSFLIFIVNFNKSEDLYLLTNKRLLFLHKKSLEYQVKGIIKLAKINKIKKLKNSGLSLWIAQKRFDLVNLENRDHIYQKIVKLKIN